LHTGAILLYHRVAEARPDTHGLCIRHEDFADHMRHLRRNYQTISLEELIAATQSRDVPERAVAVTLDDGYLDNLLTASPVLVDLGIPATFFVTSDGLDDSREFWWDTLERIFLCDAQIPGTLDRTVAGIPSALATRTPDERMNAHGILYQALFDSTKETRDALLSRVLDWSGLRLPVRPGYRPMRKEEAIRLSGRPGHVIGAHGASHLSLPAQTPEIRKREIVESKHALERILGRRVHAFAYPFGHYDEATVDTVRDAGFLAAVTCDHAGVSCDGDSFRLPRLDVGRVPLARFEALLASVLRP